MEEKMLSKILKRLDDFGEDLRDVKADMREMKQEMRETKQEMHEMNEKNQKEHEEMRREIHEMNEKMHRMNEQNQKEHEEMRKDIANNSKAIKEATDFIIETTKSIAKTVTEIRNTQIVQTKQINQLMLMQKVNFEKDKSQDAVLELHDARMKRCEDKIEILENE